MTPDPGIAEEIRRYRSQHARNPEGLVFARLADAYRRAGDPERALELLEDGLERHPRYLSALVVRARTLADLDRRDAALDAFEHVLELDPRNLVALRAVARLALEAERPDRAAAACRRLCELDPQDEEARERLEEVERLQAGAAARREDSADAGASEVAAEPTGREAEPTDVEAEPADVTAEPTDRGKPAADDEGVVVTVTMAELLLRQGLYEQAERMFERLLDRHPGNPLLDEKLEMARRLVRGEAVSVPGAGRTVPERASGAAGGSGNGAATGDAAATPEGEAAPAARSQAEPDGDRGAGAPTIRKYLERLLEGRAEAGVSASRFSRWLRDEGEG